MITINAEAGTTQWIREIEDLKQDILGFKTRRFLEAVGDRGIYVARQNCYEYGQYISFTKEINGTSVTVLAKDTQLLPVSWKTRDDNIHTVEISPILMTEFGSGNYAVNDFEHPEGGQGTFPNQTHAFQPVWFWEDLDGVLHSSSGMKPERPMYQSYMTLMYEIEYIAKQIF